MTQLEYAPLVHGEQKATNSLGVIAQTFSQMPEFLQEEKLGLTDGLAEYARLTQEARVLVLDAQDLDTLQLVDTNAAIDVIDGVVTSLRMRLPDICPSTFADRVLCSPSEHGSTDPNPLRKTLMDYARYYSTDPNTTPQELVKIYKTTLQSSDFSSNADEFADGIPVVAQVVNTIDTLYFSK